MKEGVAKPFWYFSLSNFIIADLQLGVKIFGKKGQIFFKDFERNFGKWTKFFWIFAYEQNVTLSLKIVINISKIIQTLESLLHIIHSILVNLFFNPNIVEYTKDVALHSHFLTTQVLKGKWAFCLFKIWNKIFSFPKYKKKKNFFKSLSLQLLSWWILAGGAEKFSVWPKWNSKTNSDG